MVPATCTSSFCAIPTSGSSEGAGKPRVHAGNLVDLLRRNTQVLLHEVGVVPAVDEKPIDVNDQSPNHFERWERQDSLRYSERVITLQRHHQWNPQFGLQPWSASRDQDVREQNKTRFQARQPTAEFFAFNALLSLHSAQHRYSEGGKRLGTDGRRT